MPPRKPRRTKRDAPRRPAGKIVDVIGGVPVVDVTEEGHVIQFVGWQPGITIVERTEELPGVTVHHVRSFDAPTKRKAAKRTPRR